MKSTFPPLDLMLSGRAFAGGFSGAPPLLAPRERPVLSVALLLTAIIALAVTSGTVTYGGALDAALVFPALLWTCAILAGLRSMSVVENAIKVCVALLTLGLLSALASAALAVVSRPLADGALMAADRAILGFTLWPWVTSLYGEHPILVRSLSYAYVTIEWQPFLLAAALCVSRQYDFAWRFATAWGLCLLLCILLFPLAPATGAYVHLGIRPQDMPDVLVHAAWDAPATLQRFKRPGAHVLDWEALHGIVTMPSFHAAAAVLLGWGFIRVRTLSLGFVALDAAMWVSSVPVGGHYLVDLVVGTALAAVAIGLSAVPLERSRSSPPR